MPELTVVVPAYRECENVASLLSALAHALQGVDREAIFVVDDAVDGTEEYVRERAQQDSRIHCLDRFGRAGVSRRRAWRVCWRARRPTLQ